MLRTESGKRVDSRELSGGKAEDAESAEEKPGEASRQSRVDSREGRKGTQSQACTIDLSMAIASRFTGRRARRRCDLAVRCAPHAHLRTFDCRLSSLCASVVHLLSFADQGQFSLACRLSPPNHA